MTGSVAGQHYGTQNAQGRCAAIAANAEEPLETGGDTEPLRKGTTSGRIGPPEVVCVIPSGSDCHPEQTRGMTALQSRAKRACVFCVAQCRRHTPWGHQL